MGAARRQGPRLHGPRQARPPAAARDVDKYGYDDIAAELDRRDGWPPAKKISSTAASRRSTTTLACNITQKQDWIDLYATPYYFGCEADDRMNAVAFSKINPFGARINAIFSSDIGHFDVPDMLMPVPEAYELVEDGLITERRFPRLHLRQRGAAVGHAEPALLRRHAGRQGSRRGACRTALAIKGRRRVTGPSHPPTAPSAGDAVVLRRKPDLVRWGLRNRSRRIRFSELMQEAQSSGVTRRNARSGNADYSGRSHPTRPSPKPPGLGSVLANNIRMLEERRRREETAATLQERIADAITRFTGSMRFVYLHIAIFGAWIIVNLGWIPGIPKFDPSFVILAMAASVEAIFLSTFILITQNRMTAAAQKRAELDLQINLLAEHEVTKIVAMLSAVAKRLDVKTGIDAEISELQEDVAPEAVLDQIEERQP